MATSKQRNTRKLFRRYGEDPRVKECMFWVHRMGTSLTLTPPMLIPARQVDFCSQVCKKARTLECPLKFVASLARDDKMAWREKCQKEAKEEKLRIMLGDMADIIFD